jgi:hypothetical protein
VVGYSETTQKRTFRNILWTLRPRMRKRQAQWKRVGAPSCHSKFHTDQTHSGWSAFCCLADLTNPVESKRKLVGAVGIETTSS